MTTEQRLQAVRAKIAIARDQVRALKFLLIEIEDDLLIVEKLLPDKSEVEK